MKLEWSSSGKYIRLISKWSIIRTLLFSLFSICLLPLDLIDVVIHKEKKKYFEEDHIISYHHIKICIEDRFDKGDKS